MELVVFEGDTRTLKDSALGGCLCFGEGVRSSLVPSAESAKCEDIEPMVSGRRDGDSAGDRCAAGGEAVVGSGGLSMVASVEPSNWPGSV